MGTFDSSGAFMPMKVLRMIFLLLLRYCFNIYLLRFFTFLVCILYQKSGKETILEEFEFKGIEEEEDEGDSLADMERNSAEGDKDKGEARPDVFI